MDSDPRASAPDQRMVWETIADSFHQTRERTWDHVEAFLRSLPPERRVLDLMCGNGRHGRLAAAMGHAVVAADWSQGLLRHAHGPGIEAVGADATALPFVDGCLDACIYVAGLHGIPDPQGRAASLRELRRVLRPGGLAQVTVWSRDAPRFKEEGTPGEPVDVIIPWRSGGHDLDRTYHLHTRESLRQDALDAGFEIVDEAAVCIVSKNADAPDNLVITLKA